MDNVRASDVVGSSGPSFASDDIGGVHYPISKLAYGVLDSATLVSTTNPLPVQTAGASAIRGLKVAPQTKITSSTGETTIGAAVASTYLDLYGLLISNTSASPCKVTIRDDTGGTTRMVIEVPATDVRGFMLPVDSAIPQTVLNKNWTAQCGSSVDSIEITACFVKTT